LLVGNDNDFLAGNCVTSGIACGQAVNSDAMVLAYRLTLPTYVDPTGLKSMITSGPISLGVTQMAAHDLATSGDLDRHLQDVGLGGMVHQAQLAGVPLALGASGSYITRGESPMTPAATLGGGTVGLDAELDAGMLAGLAVGYYTGSSKSTAGYHV